MSCSTTYIQHCCFKIYNHFTILYKGFHLKKFYFSKSFSCWTKTKLLLYQLPFEWAQATHWISSTHPVIYQFQWLLVHVYLDWLSSWFLSSFCRQLWIFFLPQASVPWCRESWRWVPGITRWLVPSTIHPEHLVTGSAWTPILWRKKYDNEFDSLLIVFKLNWLLL